MDSLDPQLYPQFQPSFGRYHKYALEACRPLRFALGYEGRQHVIPDASNTAVIGNGRFESRISLRPQSYLWGLVGYSEEVEGFRVQITDLGTGAKLTSERINHANLTGQGTTSGISGPLYLLPAPRLVLEPAVLSVQIENLSASTNTIQLVLLTAEPPPEGIREKNEWNLQLDAEAARARRALRGASVVSVPGEAPIVVPTGGSASADEESTSEPIEIAAAGKTVVIAGFGSVRIRIYELSLYNAGVNSITLWDGATKKLHGTLTDLPPGAGFFLPPSEKPHFQPLSPGNSFIIETTEATQVSGFVRYRME
jgi:hypothetical protein